MPTLGGHYGKVKGGCFGHGGHYGPKRADIMVWEDTLVGADTMVHDIRHWRHLRAGCGDCCAACHHCVDTSSSPGRVMLVAKRMNRRYMFRTVQ